MPFKTLFDPTHDLVIHEGHGLLSYEDIRVELFSCFGEAGWVYHSIWDLRDASLELLTAEEVRTLAENAMVYAKMETGKKNAWVATSAVDFGLCRMSEMFAEGSGLHLYVFQDFNDAIDWIKA